MPKRLPAMIIAACLTAGALTSCSSDNGDNGQSSGVSSSTIPVPPAVGGMLPESARTPHGTEAILEGTIRYRQRMALPRDAVVVVELMKQDEEREGQPVAQREFTAPGQVPIRFELPYDRAKLDTSNNYGVRVNISVDGAPWFSNETLAPAIVGGTPQDVDVMVQPVPVSR